MAGCASQPPESGSMIDRNELRWHRDAIIYQLDVKSFLDANDDGIGDIGGLTGKLDYIEDPGARLQDKI
jgi:maltose alpha-D-glucosyltransferase/alpha-amylase